MGWGVDETRLDSDSTALTSGCVKCLRRRGVARCGPSQSQTTATGSAGQLSAALLVFPARPPARFVGSGLQAERPDGAARCGIE